MQWSFYLIQLASQFVLHQGDMHELARMVLSAHESHTTALWLIRTRLGRTAVVAIMLHGQWWATHEATTYERRLLDCNIPSHARSYHYAVVLPNRQRQRIGYGLAALRSAALTVMHHQHGGLIESTDGGLAVYSPEFGWLISPCMSEEEWSIMTEIVATDHQLPTTTLLREPAFRAALARLPDLPQRELGLLLLRFAMGSCCADAAH